MLTTLKIENFRRFRELTFPTLKRVNLIAGKNNTGKTGVLEAIFVLLGEDIQTLPTVFRKCGEIGNPRENFWKWQYHNAGFDHPIVISSDSEEIGRFARAVTSKAPPQRFRVSLQTQDFSWSLKQEKESSQEGSSIRLGGLPSPPPFPPNNLKAAFLPAWPSNPTQDAIEFDRMVLKSGAEERLETLLRKIEPAVRTIRSVKPYGAPLLYADIGLAERIPVVHLGQGFSRLLSIYSAMIAGDRHVLLIDEVENGLHHSILIDIWRGLLQLAETENVQIFATTHSYECVVAAHKAFAETLNYDFSLHRLDEVKGEIQVTTFDRESLETSLQRGWEVR